MESQSDKNIDIEQAKQIISQIQNKSFDEIDKAKEDEINEMFDQVRLAIHQLNNAGQIKKTVNKKKESWWQSVKSWCQSIKDAFNKGVEEEKDHGTLAGFLHGSWNVAKTAFSSEKFRMSLGAGLVCKAISIPLTFGASMTFYAFTSTLMYAFPGLAMFGGGVMNKFASNEIKSLFQVLNDDKKTAIDKKKAFLQLIICGKTENAVVCNKKYLEQIEKAEQKDKKENILNENQEKNNNSNINKSKEINENNKEKEKKYFIDENNSIYDNTQQKKINNANTIGKDNIDKKNEEIKGENINK